MGLRVARVVPDFLPLEKAYGYYVTFSMLTSAQQSLGNEVTLFYPRSTPKGDLEFKVKPVGDLSPAYFALGASLRRRLGEFDVVHGHARAALPLAGLEPSSPVVVHLHGLPYHVTEHTGRFDPHDATAFMYYRAFLRKADCVITYCNSLRRKVIEIFRLDPARVVHIPNGVEPQYFRAKDHLREQLGIRDSPAVIYVGRFSEVKGIFEFLESIPSILRRVPDAKFLFVGCNSALPKFLSRHEIEMSCMCVQHVPYNKVGAYYRSADVHVALSKVYGYQKTVLESLASGTPVVTSDYPDARRLVGSAGLFTDPNKPEMVAAAVCQALEDDELRINARSRSKEIMRQYTWRKAAERIQDVYSHLMA